MSVSAWQVQYLVKVKVKGQVSLFVAGAVLHEGQVSFFVAGAVFGEVLVSLFVAGAIFGEGLNVRLGGKCCILQ